MDKVKIPGFRKADLHVHTPKSLCYRERSTTPEQIVDSAVAAGLEVIAVTDHNTVEAIDDFRRVGREKGLFVFPGVELSTKSGHVIALFDLDTPVEWLVDFLGYVGITRELWGDATATTGSSIEEVLYRTWERGGLNIAAHIERWPSGFLETNEPRRVKMRIHSSQYLNALEITVPQNKRLWNSGQIRSYPKKYACIQGSDAHSLEDIGRRPVYIQMERVNLQALRSAFLDYETKILFPEELG
jgi:PHP family Zn ribbon phosphoesterase